MLTAQLLKKLFRNFTQIKLMHVRAFSTVQKLRSGAARLLPAWHGPDGRAKQDWRQTGRAGNSRRSDWSILEISEKYSTARLLFLVLHIRSSHTEYGLKRI